MRVVVCRHGGPGLRLVEDLRRRGIAVDHMPVLSEIPVEAPVPDAWFAHASAILVGSVAAAKVVARSYERVGSGIQICAVGKATAAALEIHGIPVSLVGAGGMVQLADSWAQRSSLRRGWVVLASVDRPRVSAQELSVICRREVRHWVTHRLEENQSAIQDLKRLLMESGAAYAIVLHSGRAAGVVVHTLRDVEGIGGTPDFLAYGASACECLAAAGFSYVPLAAAGADDVVAALNAQAR